MPDVIAPVAHRDDAYFWDAAREHRLVAQRCLDCSTLRHPAASFCGICQSSRWAAADLSGRATVFSWVVSKSPDASKRTGAAEEPGRIVAVVELAEGFALVTNLVDVDPLADLRGLPVEVFYRDFGDGVVLPQFRPVGSEVTS